DSAADKRDVIASRLLWVAEQHREGTHDQQSEHEHVPAQCHDAMVHLIRPEVQSWMETFQHPLPRFQRFFPSSPRRPLHKGPFRDLGKIRIGEGGDMQKKAGQLSLADGLVRGANNFLAEADGLIDWSEIEQQLEGIYSASTGRPSYPLLTLFKA